MAASKAWWEGQAENYTCAPGLRMLGGNILLLFVVLKELYNRQSTLLHLFKSYFELCIVLQLLNLNHYDC
jgi:hypothetical protein